MGIFNVFRLNNFQTSLSQLVLALWVLGKKGFHGNSQKQGPRHNKIIEPNVLSAWKWKSGTQLKAKNAKETCLLCGTHAQDLMAFEPFRTESNWVMHSKWCKAGVCCLQDADPVGGTNRKAKMAPHSAIHWPMIPPTHQIDRDILLWPNLNRHISHVYPEGCMNLNWPCNDSLRMWNPAPDSLSTRCFYIIPKMKKSSELAKNAFWDKNLFS